jgi:hypothetical protein
MVVMSEVANLAIKLADLKLFQNTLIEVGQKLMTETDDGKIRERLEGMIKRDRLALHQTAMGFAIQLIAYAAVPCASAG